jgi:hypothetical protein
MLGVRRHRLFRRIHRALWGALLLVSVAAPAARADEDPEALIREGIDLRRQGDDAKALGYFKRAYDLAHTPRAAAQLGLANQALGHNLESQRYLTEALAARDPWVEQHRAVLEKSRQTVRQQLGKIELRGLPGGATIETPGQAAEAVAADHVVWVAPGAVTLTLSAPGHDTMTKATVVAAGAGVIMDVAMPSTAPAVPPEPDGHPMATPVATPPAAPSGASEAAGGGDDGRALRVASLVTAGAGVALGVTGFFVYRAGLSKLNAIKRDASANGGSGVAYSDANANYQMLGDAGIGMMVAGGVVIAADAVLYVLGRGMETESTGTSVSLDYAPGVGGHILVGGRF